MKVFLINIPAKKVEEWYPLSHEILMDYFKSHNIEVFTLDKNEFGVDPSWLKLKCFDYVDDDFVLCWDMDLLPRKGCPSIVPSLDLGKINLAVDSIFYTKVIEPPPFAPYHRYNCGLMGLPRSYRPMLDKVFQESKTSKLPSYEQYPMNLELSKNGFEDVHELDNTWNCIFHLPNAATHFNSTSDVIHYTGVIGATSRKKLIQLHHRLYFL